MQLLCLQGLLHYHVPDHNILLSEIFTKMEKLKQEHQLIEDYTVSDTTLEEVFLTFAREVVTRL